MGGLYFSACKPCNLEKDKERRMSKTPEERQEIGRRNREKMGKDYHKDYKLKKNYGFGLETFNEMVERQQNSCKICGDEFTENRPAQVDHNHDTGEVRDLLCTPCNTSLGLMKEDINRLTSMIEYINGHS